MRFSSSRVWFGIGGGVIEGGEGDGVERGGLFRWD